MPRYWSTLDNLGLQDQEKEEQEVVGQDHDPPSLQHFAASTATAAAAVLPRVSTEEHRGALEPHIKRGSVMS